MRPDLARVFSLVLLLPAAHALADDPAGPKPDKNGWVHLLDRDLDAFKFPRGDWRAVGGIGLDAKDPKRLDPTAKGEGIWYNGPLGKTLNLVTKQSFGDCEVHLEFLVPKGSN